MKSQLTGKKSDAGKEQEDKGQQRMRRLVSVTDRMDMSLNRFREIVKDRGAWCASFHGVAKSRTQQ